MERLLFVLFFALAATLLLPAQEVTLATGEWPPYTTVQAKDQGFVTAIVQAVAKELGWKTKVGFYPWKRCEDLVRSGEAWAAFPYVDTPEREKDFDFTASLGQTRGVFFYDKDKYPTPPVWSKLADLKDYSIGGVLGSWYEKDFAAAGLKVTYSAAEEDNLANLAKGAVKLAPSDQLLGNLFFAAHFPQAHIGTLEKPLNQSEIQLLVSRSFPKSKELLAAFNSGLAKIKKSGVYAKILAEYGLK